MSPWKEVSLDCTELDQWLMLTRPFWFDISAAILKSPLHSNWNLSDPQVVFLVWGWMTLIIDTIVDKYYTIITCFAFCHVNLFCKTSLRTFKGFHSLLYIQIIFLDESGPKVIDNGLSHNSSKMSTSNAIFLTLKCYFAFPLVFCWGKMTPLDEALQERILPLTLQRSSSVCCDVANCEIAMNNFNILSNFV